MAASQQSTLSLALNALLNDSGSALGVVASVPLSYAFAEVLSGGTGANQANQIFMDRRTLTTGATESLDLAGALTNLLGQTITFTKVKLILIVNPATNTTSLTVGNAASNQFATFLGAVTHTVGPINPGGFFAIGDPGANGYAVVAATGDLLKIANSAGASITYDIVIIGC
jgi:hypothetical protein